MRIKLKKTKGIMSEEEIAALEEKENNPKKEVRCPRCGGFIVIDYNHIGGADFDVNFGIQKCFAA